MHRTPLIVSGTLFALFAVLHLWRLVTQKQIILGDTVVPFWVSVVALIVAALLSIWMFASARCFSVCCQKGPNERTDEDNEIQ